jgi:hypothetical protein
MKSKTFILADNIWYSPFDGEEKRIRRDDISSALGRASEEEKSTFEISPSGYGIHWPLIDEYRDRWPAWNYSLKRAKEKNCITSLN